MTAWLLLAACSPRFGLVSAGPVAWYRDEDRDGYTDEGVDVTWWFPDRDGDGWGAELEGVARCGEPEPGEVDQGGDCDDSRADVHPTATDPLDDGVDWDCDGRDGCPEGGRWEGDLVFEGAGAREAAEAFCASSWVVGGSVTVRGVDWTDPRPLSCLCEVEGDLRVQDNVGLVDLAGLERLEAVGGYLWLEDVPALVSLGGLARLGQAGSVLVVRAQALRSLDGLAGLRGEMTGDLWLNDTGVIELRGPPGLTRLDQLVSKYNPALQRVVGFDNVETMGGIHVEDSSTGDDGVPASGPGAPEVADGAGGGIAYEGFPRLSTLGTAESFRAGVSRFVLPSLRELSSLDVSRGAEIRLPNVTRIEFLSGPRRNAELPALTRVGGLYVSVGDGDSSALDGLSSLEVVEITLSIRDEEPTLTSLDPLHGIQRVMGSIDIRQNQGFYDAEAWELVDAIGEHGGSPEWIYVEDNGLEE